MAQAAATLHDGKVWSIEIDKLRQHPDNPNNGDTDSIAESLLAHGQYKPLVVQRDSYTILAGNHTWVAAQEIGWTHIDCVFVHVDDEEGVRIMLADNEIPKRARPDLGKLRAILEDLRERKALMGTGHDDESVTELVNRVRRTANAALDPDRPCCSECGRPLPKVRS